MPSAVTVPSTAVEIAAGVRDGSLKAAKNALKVFGGDADALVAHY